MNKKNARTNPLPGLRKKSGPPSNPSISDSTNRGNINTNIRILSDEEIKANKRKNYKPKTREERTGVIYDPTKKRLNAAMQANPLARLFTGIKPKSS